MSLLVFINTCKNSLESFFFYCLRMDKTDASLSVYYLWATKKSNVKENRERCPETRDLALLLATLWNSAERAKGLTNILTPLSMNSGRRAVKYCKVLRSVLSRYGQSIVSYFYNLLFISFSLSLNCCRTEAQNRLETF